MRHFIIIPLISFFLFFIPETRAENTQEFYFVFLYPEGEGDNESAQPFLRALFEQIANQTQISFSGSYINELAKAQTTLQQNNFDIAIVPESLLQEGEVQKKTTQLVQTIPLHSTGPYEKLFLVSGPGFPFKLDELPTTTFKILTTSSLTTESVRQKLFKDDARFAKTHFSVEKISDLIGSLGKITQEKLPDLLLLTNYEYGVIKMLKGKKPEYSELKLILTSAEIPSPYVVVSNTSRLTTDQRAKIKNALLGLEQSLTGKMALKNLRLSGFAPLP